MSVNEWTRYQYQRPPEGILCVFARRVWTSQSPDFPQIQQEWIGVDDFHPMFNIADLYWKVTGIGAERLASMTPEMRRQIERPIMIHAGQMANALPGIYVGLGYSLQGNPLFGYPL